MWVSMTIIKYQNNSLYNHLCYDVNQDCDFYQNKNVKT